MTDPGIATIAEVLDRIDRDAAIHRAAVALAATSDKSVSHWEHEIKMLALRAEFDAGVARHGRVTSADVMALATAPKRIAPILSLPWDLDASPSWWTRQGDVDRLRCEALASRDPR